MIDASTLEELKKALLEKQSTLRAQMTSANAGTFSDTNEGQIDEDAEEDEAEEATNRQPVKETLERDVAAVNEALERMESRAYGICMNCGAQIDVERLKAFPEAARCLECV